MFESEANKKEKQKEAYFCFKKRYFKRKGFSSELNIYAFRRYINSTKYVLYKDIKDQMAAPL